MCAITADTGVHSFRAGNYKARCSHVACVRGIGHTVVFARCTHEQTDMDSSLPLPSWSLFIHTQKRSCGRGKCEASIQTCKFVPPYLDDVPTSSRHSSITSFLVGVVLGIDDLVCENGSISFFRFPMACSLT